MEYTAHPIAATIIHKSPEVNLKFSNNCMLPLLIIVKTPIKQTRRPIILENVILSLKNIVDKMIINIGDDV